MKVRKELSKPSDLSREYVVDSDNEASSSDASASSDPAPLKNGRISPLKRKRSSSEDSRRSKSSEEESDDSGSNSSRPSADTDKNEEELDASDSEAESSSSERSQSPENSIPAKSFNAPAGFGPARQSKENDLRGISVLSDLAGKGLWHITAPASVPLSSIKSFGLDALGSGERVFSAKGNQYRFRSEALLPHNQRRLLILDGRTNSYKPTKQVISQTLHVQQIVDPPRAYVQSEEERNHAIADASAMPYPQPENMKMRYRPFCTEDAPPEILGEASEEIEDEAPAFRVPPGLSSPESTGSPKETKSDMAAAVSTPQSDSESDAEDTSVQSKLGKEKAASATKTPQKSKTLNLETDESRRDKKKRKNSGKDAAVTADQSRAKRVDRDPAERLSKKTKSPVKVDGEEGEKKKKKKKKRSVEAV